MMLIRNIMLISLAGLLILDQPVIFIMAHMYMALLEAPVLLVNSMQDMHRNQL
jgi:thiosulfate reductase cytochrome b subunit